MHSPFFNARISNFHKTLFRASYLLSSLAIVACSWSSERAVAQVGWNVTYATANPPLYDDVDTDLGVYQYSSLGASLPENPSTVFLRNGDSLNVFLFMTDSTWSLPPVTDRTQFDWQFSPNGNGSTFESKGSWYGSVSLYRGTTLLAQENAYGSAFRFGTPSDAISLQTIFPASLTESGGLLFDAAIFEGTYSGDPIIFRTTDGETGGFASFTAFSSYVVPEPSTYIMGLAGLACGGFSMWRQRLRA